MSVLQSVCLVALMVTVLLWYVMGLLWLCFEHPWVGVPLVAFTLLVGVLLWLKPA